jgi:hypothetical protein
MCDLCNTIYPVETDFVISIVKSKLINLSYYSIYYFSCGQILFANIKERSAPKLKLIGNAVNQFLINNHVIHPNSIQNPASLILEFYLDGKNTLQLDVLDMYENIVSEKFEVSLPQEAYTTVFDLIIVSYKECGKDCTNKLHFNLLPTYFNYSKSYIRFLSMELTYENTVYSIKLDTDFHNHYYVGNIIDSQFFKYYLTNVVNLEIDINSKQFDYSVSLIDHNVNIVTLVPSQTLIIRKNDYEIHTETESVSDDEFKEYINLDNTNY